jgi:hypothetical protein
MRRVLAVGLLAFVSIDDSESPIFDGNQPLPSAELSLMRLQDIYFARLKPEDSVYFLFYCPETLSISGRNEIRFNMTFFNTTRKMTIAKNITAFANKSIDYYEEFSVRVIPPKSSVEFVFDELAKRTILGIEPDSWTRLSANISYLDTYETEGSKKFPVTYNMSLYNLKNLRIEINNHGNEPRRVNLYLKTYLPMAGSVRPGVLFLIITFVIVVVLFIIVTFMILLSSRLIREPTVR